MKGLGGVDMLYEQFAKPEGWIGKLAGKYMERENEALNEWTIHFLTLEEGTGCWRSASVREGH